MRTLILLLPAALAGYTAVAVELYVAPGGRDEAAGTRETPLASLQGARDRVRALKAPAAGSVAEAVTVTFAPGVYRVRIPVDFTAADSGRETAPIVYRAEPGGAVRFTGADAVTDWQPVTDKAILARLPEAARPHVRVADLKAAGIHDYGTLSPRGFSMGGPPAEAELFFDGRPMTLARWPNDGFRGARKRLSPVEVQVDTDRVRRWQDEADPWVFAYWHHDWAELYEPIEAVRTNDNVLVRSEKITPRYGITPSRVRWYGLNLLAELDQPGEYYIDRASGKLYFFRPPAEAGRAELSQAEGFIRGRNLAHVTFRGFTFDMCRGHAIAVQEASDCRLQGCVIRNAGLGAARFSNARRCQVFGCDVYDCGEGGISLSGGDRRTLTPGENVAENNHVYRYSRRARTYKAGIRVHGCGNRILRNLVHDGPHMALSAGGNDHVVEGNEIHNVVYESGDAGAYYVGRDWTQRGNVLRYNYWHCIVGPGQHSGMTIYLDDQHSGHTIVGNVFERCARAVFIGGGDDNLVSNNVFVSCWKAVHVDNRGMGWQKQATDDPKGTLRTLLRAVPYTNELWRSRYPTLPGILEDEPNIPKRNVFVANVSAGGTWDDIHPAIRHYQTVTNNLACDSDSGRVELVKEGNGELTDIRFKDPAAVRAIGFQPIPLDAIGLYDHPLRASWPVRRTVRPVTLPGEKQPGA
ncbi:MAG: right-handed parallel beta-helix repeat-containing protein [Lentisphaerae bacterium]|nr:right-handed parallel beta-helix repeat-containing protein [Lentisphaerota bacterium]